VSTYDRHIAWENLIRDIEAGTPKRIPIHGTPKGEFVVAPGGKSLAVRIVYDGAEVQVVDMPSSIDVMSEALEDEMWLRVESGDPNLFQHFHSFASTMLDLVQLDGKDPVSAMHETIEAWRNLLKRPSRMSDEQEIGLLGELWVLWHLIERHGSDALKMWTGVSGEPHDFRLGPIDLEVKTTRTVRRVHTINGLHQLAPVGETPLLLLSLQFQPAPPSRGMSLPDWIDRVREAIWRIGPSLVPVFDKSLREAFDYHDHQAHNFNTQFELRTAPMLIPVDESVPRLTPTSVHDSLGESAHRLVAVTYQVDFTGLGFPPTDSRFAELLFIPS
jgi:hypothetical protein